MLIFHKQYDEKYLLIKETLAEAIDTRWLGMQKNSLLRLARRNTFKMYLHYMLGVGRLKHLRISSTTVDG